MFYPPSPCIFCSTKYSCKAHTQTCEWWHTATDEAPRCSISGHVTAMEASTNDAIIALVTVVL